MSDLFLVTGGTGKTGRRVAALLRDRASDVRIATRNPQIPGQVRFDWGQPDLFAAALGSVKAVYLVAPTDRTDHLAVMKPFLQCALGMGVSRFVLLSASSLQRGGAMMGEVHDWLAGNVPEFCILRPTWFMQNFSEQQHRTTIRDESRIYSATGEGRVPFINADDIAASAVAALTTSSPPNTDMILTGPEALSYEAVASEIGLAAGRKIDHVCLSEDHLAARFTILGMEAGYARGLASMDTAIAKGSENRLSDGVFRLTGRQPGAFRDFVRRNRSAWAMPRAASV
ncbi:ergot alkaloid biosynthesis protein [Labrenzia sp. OB1]|uniref:ergot alkaloid biosynthesis protein n=1 Tax=Labrenzia sp. OB1 TaxID=1561204 RepID=UPI0007B24CAD|nr:ergot alkaloid biosynthesis protein [Labrenzia sp. OB1]KZM51548.1 hypothetical protein OA90_03625 [Labrenzia sp. OB1]